GDRRVEANTLNNIANVYADLAEYQKALEFYNEALPIKRAMGNRLGEATTLGNIGLVYGNLGDQHKALEFFNQALPISREIGDRPGEARTLNNIGVAYEELGDPQKALEFFNQSLPLTRAVGDRPYVAETLYHMAHVERDRNNLPDARRFIESTLSIVEALRAGYSNQELRSVYFASVQDYYEFYIGVLMRLHKLHPQDGLDSLALQSSERARARALLETLAEAGADIREGVDPKLLERERSLQKQLNAKAKDKIDLLGGEHTAAEEEAIDKEIEDLTAEFQQVEAAIRQTSPRYAALTQPQPLTLTQIQQVLDPDTLLLEYSLGEDQSYLWAVTSSSLTSYALPKREDIQQVARRVYNLFSRTQLPGEQFATNEKRSVGLGQSEQKHQPTLDTATPQELSRMLLSPVASQLRRKRLVIIADGILQFIPFSALPKPLSTRSRGTAPPLIAEHEIVSLPSASTLAVLRRDVQGREVASKAIAVLADPVFSRTDERLTKTTATMAKLTPASQASREDSRDPGLAVEQLREAAGETNVSRDGFVIHRLPFTRREAEQIAALVQPQEKMEALDFAASRATIMNPEMSRYRYVHIATHGFLDSYHPELSGLVLSMVNEKGEPLDGFLRAHEVFNLKLPAEVVVLSACQTGLGKDVKGEGLIGLTRAFMYAGSPRVVVSLWSVNDEATAELMVRFYRGMLKQRLRPAKALQEAQVSMMKDKEYSAPFYWAAFTLQGEWR
ncbi:MAG: hypothetical protein C5B55_09430, partial [Blastocatellia bacterium]